MFSATSPCPFSPSPSHCEVRLRCLRHLGLLPWKQGRIKAGARSAGIRPLGYLSSRLRRFQQGPHCPPQAPQLVGRSARAWEGQGGGRRGAEPLRTWERGEAAAEVGLRVAGPTHSPHGHLPSPGPGDCSPRGSHVGARRNFPGTGANFAVAGPPEGPGEVVPGRTASGAWPAAPAARTASLPPPSAPGGGKVCGAGHRAPAILLGRGVPGPRPWRPQPGGGEGARARAPPGKLGRAVRDRPGAAWSGWTGPHQAPEAGDVCLRGGRRCKCKTL